MAVPLSPLALRPASAGHPRRSTYTEVRGPGRGPIACLWIGSPGWSPRTLRLLPDGCVDVVWDGKTIRVIPPRPVAVRHTLVSQGLTVGVRLRPGWAAPILGTSIGTLPQVADMGKLGRDLPVASLARMLSEAPNPTASAQVLAHHLASIDGPTDASVLTAVDLLSQRGLPVQDTAVQVGHSVRHLRRCFHNQVGLSPKAFQRIARFQRFRHLVTSPGPTLTMARAAAICGYNDQAHLVHDCRELADTTPTALVRAALSPTGHNPAD